MSVLLASMALVSFDALAQTVGTSTDSSGQMVSRAAELESSAFSQQLRALSSANFSPIETQRLRDILVADRLDALRFRGALTTKKILKPTGTAKPGEFPWMMALEVYHPIERRWIAFCGGTLIAPKVLLSAAHCTDFPKEYLRVVTSTIDLNKETDAKYVSISRVLPHPDFAHTALKLANGKALDGLVYDFALFFLKDEVQGPTVRLAIDSSKTQSVARGLGRSMGWGITDNGDASAVLLYVDVPLVGDDECGKSYDPLAPSMICAGYKAGGGDACSGDSGGPLLVSGADSNLLQVGVVSFGEGCGLPGYYSIYAWIGAGLDWLREQVGPLQTGPSK